MPPFVEGAELESGSCTFFVIEFPTEQRAAQFERYLKSGSGRAFAKRHFAAVPQS
jgi:hypothetical protein